MATIRKKGRKEVPAISTSSLPDIIFMLLFFFMATTSMKEVEMMVKISAPEATELQSLEKKSRVRYVYVGVPRDQYTKVFGKETRIQLEDSFADVSQLEEFVVNERESMSEEDQPYMTISIKADKETQMGIITDIKQALRRAYALKISYAAAQRTSY
ncbi:MAG: biopolymer transporter ExbD [Paludibacteraceae bacterium]|nr:biopolymer transporter ExbD [Paludibacteraceae bacterium]